MSKLRLSGAFDYQALARQTPGYVGADLSALTGAAGVFAVKRIFDQLGAPSSAAALEAMHLDEAPEGSAAIVAAAAFQTLPDNLRQLPISRFLSAHPESLSEEQLATLAITNDDFTAALATVQPSSQREGFTTVPDVTWDDLGALNQIQEEIRMSIVRPIQRPELFASLGIQAPCGVLLWGPPGCGKTLLAKAVANESHANFISIKGPELLNKVRMRRAPQVTVDSPSHCAVRGRERTRRSPSLQPCTSLVSVHHLLRRARCFGASTR